MKLVRTGRSLQRENKNLGSLEREDDRAEPKHTSFPGAHWTRLTQGGPVNNVILKSSGKHYQDSVLMGTPNNGKVLESTIKILFISTSSLNSLHSHSLSHMVNKSSVVENKLSKYQLNKGNWREQIVEIITIELGKLEVANCWNNNWTGKIGDSKYDRYELKCREDWNWWKHS